MAIMDLLRGPDINQGVEEYKNTPGAFLIDVRSPQEYASGHVPGSENIPVQAFREIEELVENKETPLFVYCLSGSRSGRVVRAFQTLGYTNVKNIGGVSAYRGELER